MDEESIFAAAIECKSTAERVSFLDSACRGEQQLRSRVEALLASHDNAGTFLNEPAAPVATLDQSITEKPGIQIGPYKLLQQIGEGGMGAVFMAEQSEPIQRTVALKIIKPGMDSRQVIARFEAERQAVAMMDHPNIAKVLDAGTTDSGRPYFVMELVKGVPITKYCDEKHLPLSARLELFVQVCQAVQHAHQKGIIHRDIKPNNVLVAEYDNHPIPKVIDFGVAKATAQKLTERTMFTEFGQVLGTMEYMSPEQSKFNQLDIDTRSDIYSLGVLLYELLAGSTPFEGERLHAAAYDEMLRIIREEEPPKPSTRLSSIDTLPSVAVNRHTEPARLSKDVRGELDWIVMRALEKDRNRRYETASGFAADIERHLHDEPVEAGPPSTMYRFRKFARRNKSWLALALLAVAGLMTALVGLLISNVLISSERNQKVAALKSAEDNLVLALKALDEVYLQGIGQDRLLLTSSDGELPTVRDHMPFTDDERQLLERGLKFYEQFAIQNASRADVRFQVAQANRRIGDICIDLGERERARKAFSEAIAFLNILTAKEPANPTYWDLLGRVYSKLNKTEESRPARAANYEQAVQAFTKWIDLQPRNVDAYIERMDVYEFLYLQGLSEQGIELAAADGRRAVELAPNNAHAQLKYASILCVRDHKDPLAVEHAEAAVRLDPNNWKTHVKLSGIHSDNGNNDRAMRSAKRAVELSANENTYTALAWAYFNRGDLEQALITAEEGIRRTRSGGLNRIRARIREKRGDYSGALADLDIAIAQFHFAVDGQTDARRDRARLYMKFGRYNEAIEDWTTIANLPWQRQSWLAPYAARAVAHLQLGHKEEALRDLELAFESDTLNRLPPIDAPLAAKFQDPVIQERLRGLLKKAQSSPTPGKSLVNLAGFYLKIGMYANAGLAYQSAVEIAPDDVGLLNIYAWNLATCPNSEFVDGPKAVELAEKAVQLSRDDGNNWNTLGVAHYRAGNWQAAIKALETSMELRDGGDASDWFFLAMSHWQLGHKADTRTWYEKAVEWTDKSQPDNEELRRFRAEAEELLKITDEKPTTKPSVDVK